MYYLEIFDNMNPNLEVLKLILDMMDWSILAIFFLEILLKWLDNFMHFWKSTWNVFDFVVTFLVRLCKTVNTAHSQQAV